jgi:hypothetical protein
MNISNSKVGFGKECATWKVEATFRKQKFRLNKGKTAIKKHFEKVYAQTTKVGL